MSEAGPRWLNRGTGGGFAALLSAPATEQGERGLVGGRRFGPGKRRHGCAACGKGPWFRWRSSAERPGGRIRRDRERQRSRFAARAREDNAQRGSCPALTGIRAAPLWGSRHDDCSWCTRHPHSAAPSGVGYAVARRLTGVNVDGVAPKRAQTVRAARQGPKTVVRPAQAGSCPGNWRFYRVPVY